MKKTLIFLHFFAAAFLHAEEYPKFSLFTPQRIEPINFYGDGLWFSRSDPSNRLLAYDNTTGNRTFETNLINVQSRIGYQVGTDFFLTAQSRFVLNFAHGHWNQLVVKVTPETSIISPFFNSHVSRTQADYLSKLSIGEFNYQYTIVDGLSVVAGMRYFYETDDINLFQSFPDATTNLTYNVSTTNRIGALQLGGEMSSTLKELINFELALKLGAGLNFAKAQSQASLASFFDSSKKSYSTNQGVVCVEVDLLFRYQVTSKFFVRAGYDAMYLSGIASSADNISQTPLRSITINTQGLTDVDINAADQVIFTKSYVGVEYRW